MIERKTLAASHCEGADCLPFKCDVEELGKTNVFVRPKAIGAKFMSRIGKLIH